MFTATHNANNMDTGTRAISSPPLLLPVIAGNSAAPAMVGSIAEQVLARVAQRYPITVAPLVYPEQIEAGLETWLRQAEQLAFFPFGRTTTTELQALTDAIHAKLAQAAGEVVHRQTLPLPAAMPDRPVFSPFEGISCPQRQLAPLVSQFPGWQDTYLCLEAGSWQIILACGRPDPAEECHTTGTSHIISSLAAALCGQEGRLTRDGEILASYLQSLVGAVLRQAFGSQSIVSAVPSSFLLPPWLAGERN